MSLSSGTIIGEISLIIPTNSTLAIRCASVCELHTLSISAFHKVLLMFPNKIIKFRSFINGRIQQAEYLLNETTITEETKSDAIIWIKRKWKELNRIQAQKKV